MALFFAASVAMLGVFIPFWPAWLQSRGLSKLEIGALVSAWAWSRGLAGPLWAHFVDRSGRRRAWIIALAFGSLLAFAPFGFAAGYRTFFVVTVAFGALHAQVIPLGENLILFEARRLGFSYAGVRWLGSLSFLIVSVWTGWLLEGGQTGRAFPLGLGFLALTCAAAFALPKSEAAPAKSARAPLREIFGRPSLLAVLVGVGLLQAAHATYYAFSTIHWRAAGHSTTAIGWLWAEGVLAEILLFAAFGTGRIALGERGLLVLAVLGSLVRWSCLASTAALPWLVAVQWLHAFTFAAAHLAAMSYLSRHVAVELSATAQSVYSSVNIAAHALAVTSVSQLFDSSGGAAFWPMLAIATVGGALAWGGMRASRQVAGERAY